MRVPVLIGVKLTPMVQVALGLSDEGQLFFLGEIPIVVAVDLELRNIQGRRSLIGKVHELRLTRGSDFLNRKGHRGRLGGIERKAVRNSRGLEGKSSYHKGS